MKLKMYLAQICVPSVIFYSSLLRYKHRLTVYKNIVTSLHHETNMVREEVLTMILIKTNPIIQWQACLRPTLKASRKDSCSRNLSFWPGLLYQHSTRQLIDFNVQLLPSSIFRLSKSKKKTFTSIIVIIPSLLCTIQKVSQPASRPS